MQQVIHGLKQEADVVVFDTPPALTVTDAAVLSVKVDGCILVGEVGRTNRSAIVRAIESLTRSQDAHLFGIVLNKLQLRRLHYYDQAYHYHYYAYDYSKAGKKAHRRSRLPAWLAGISSRL
jgi:Mrp family chromosome partitioning ATPase